MPTKKPNLRFTDKRLLPGIYRRAFLDYLEKLAPEVLRSLEKLCPRYKAVANSQPTSGTLNDWLNGVLTGVDVDVFRRHILDELAVEDRYHITDPRKLAEVEEAAWANALELRNEFADFIETYGLTTDWLRTGLFELLGNMASGDQLRSGSQSVYSHIYVGAHGDDIELEIKGWMMAESWQEFEERARQQLETVLSDYKDRTIEFFRGRGYMKFTKPHTLEYVKWLVHWTVLRTDTETILKLIRKEKPSTMTPEDLKKEFRELARKFGLPVRRSTGRGKSAH